MYYVAVAGSLNFLSVRLFPDRALANAAGEDRALGDPVAVLAQINDDLAHGIEVTHLGQVISRLILALHQSRGRWAAPWRPSQPPAGELPYNQERFEVLGVAPISGNGRQNGRIAR